MRYFFLSCVLGLIATFAGAQVFPKAEIFGGYSYGNIQLLSDRSSANGWHASATVNFYKWFGLTSDFGGLYGANGTETTTAPSTNNGNDTRKGEPERSYIHVRPPIFPKAR
ncbi:MAG TPA: hypothetical protein VFA90_05275 [Terriglobales bacterium]|nr:hypothetical protein [Terriglobales bacterium]